MIKFGGFNHETVRPVLGIGLTRENCERLLLGQPLHFDTVGMADLPDIEVFLIGSETDQTLAQVVLDEGMLAADEIGGDQPPGEVN